MNTRDKVNRLGVGLRPFDPYQDTPQDVGFGGPSTEYLSTLTDQLGYATNVPRIWWDRNGKPHVVSDKNALAFASDYEGSSGQYFPRYNSMAQAVEAAQHRSARGGASTNALAKPLRDNPSEDFRRIIEALIKR